MTHIWVEASGQNRIVILPGANLLIDPEVAVAAGPSGRCGAVSPGVGGGRLWTRGGW